MKDFFISYNKHDKSWAEWIAWTLEEHGFSAIVQAWDFRPGGNFVLEMQKATTGARQTVAVLSDHYLEAEYTQPEWADAFARDPQGERRTLLPVRISMCRPTGLLATRIYVDLVGLSEAESRSELLSSLDERAKPSAPPVFPGEPTSQHGREAAHKRMFPGHATTEISVWREKLESLRGREADISDATQKHKLYKQIAEVEKRLETLQVCTESSSGDEVTAVERRLCCLDEYAITLNNEMDDALTRKQRLMDNGESTATIDEDILELKRRSRRGGQLRPGDRLGDRYLLLKQIGKGGFATVWRAYDHLEDREVAAKVLHSVEASSTINRDRFFRGARIMSELAEDAGIVSVLDPMGEDDGFFYFVMEFIRGGNLREAVLEGKTTAADAVPVMTDILEILQCAHNHPGKYVHRDIKPTNVLLTDNGHIKLTDFDLVTACDTTGGTRTGMLGTFLYAAPEQLWRPHKVDHRADIYSVAMTGMFILYGRDLPPHVMRTVDEFIEHLPASRQLKDVLIQAISLEPDNRFSGVADLRDALSRAANDPSPKNPKKRATRRKVNGNARTMTRQQKRYAIPDIRPKKIEEAMEMFDRDHRQESRWRNFEDNSKHRYAIEHNGERYPVKKIVSLATGIPISNFSGGTAVNKRIEELGFTIITMRDETEDDL